MSQLTKKLLILGGTGEAVRLAESAAARGLIVISSLAGRTQQSRVDQNSNEQIRVGGFGGVTGLAIYLQQERIDLVIDATHPFAQQISWNAADATEQCGIPRLLLHRPGWEAAAGDQWFSVANHEAAAVLLPRLAQRVFLTIGRQEISNYAHLSDLWFLMRSIDPPSSPLPPGEILLAKGPFTPEAEQQLLVQHQIEAIVSKNSGGSATYAKILAARSLGLPIVMIQQPVRPDGLQVATVEEAVLWLEQQLIFDHTPLSDR